MDPLCMCVYLKSPNVGAYIYPVTLVHVGLVPGEVVAFLHSVNSISNARRNEKLSGVDTGFRVLLAQHSTVWILQGNNVLPYGSDD